MTSFLLVNGIPANKLCQPHKPVVVIVDPSIEVAMIVATPLLQPGRGWPSLAHYVAGVSNRCYTWYSMYATYRCTCMCEINIDDYTCISEI